MTCTHSRGHRPLGAMQFYHPHLEVQVLHLFGLLWPLAEPESHSLPILPTCKPRSCAPGTAGGESRGAAQGGHQKSSLTANFPESPSLDAIERILKFFLIKCHCSLISFKE